MERTAQIRMVDDDFYEKHNEKIKTAIKAMLSGTAMSQDTDDCVNKVYLKLLGNPYGFDEKRGGIETYINLIVHSVVLNHLKSAGKFQKELIGDAYFDLCCSSDYHEGEAEFNTLVEGMDVRALL